MRFLLTPRFHFYRSKRTFFWVRQMFGVIKQKLNEQTIQIVEFKKNPDKTEFKKKHAAQMVDFRTILLNSKIQPIITPVFPVAFPIFVFTFTTERKKIFSKLFIYYGTEKKFNHGISRFEPNYKWILPIYRNGTHFFTSIIN